MATSRSASLKKPLRSALDSLKRTGSTLNKLKPSIASPATLKSRHTARRQASGLQLALADCIDALNPAHWDALSSQTVFLSRDYLRVLETHGPKNIQPRYAM